MQKAPNKVGVSSSRDPRRWKAVPWQCAPRALSLCSSLWLQLTFPSAQHPPLVTSLPDHTSSVLFPSALSSQLQAGVPWARSSYSLPRLGSASP